MSVPHPLLKKLLEEALGLTCHLQFLPETLDLKLSGVTASFQTVCITLVHAK